VSSHLYPSATVKDHPCRYGIGSHVRDTSNDTRSRISVTAWTTESDAFAPQAQMRHGNEVLKDHGGWPSSATVLPGQLPQADTSTDRRPPRRRLLISRPLGVVRVCAGWSQALEQDGINFQQSLRT